MIASEFIPLHFIWFATASTVGVGLTVIENVLTGPGQLFAVGVTLNVARLAVFVEFDKSVELILPLPLGAIPIELKLFVQVNVAPVTELVKLIASEFIPLHFIWFVTASTVGVGLTVTLTSLVGVDVHETEFKIEVVYLL